MFSYTACDILKCSFNEFVRWSWPFIAAVVAFFVLLALVPDIVLYLPNKVMAGK